MTTTRHGLCVRPTLALLAAVLLFTLPVAAAAPKGGGGKKGAPPPAAAAKKPEAPKPAAPPPAPAKQAEPPAKAPAPAAAPPAKKLPALAKGAVAPVKDGATTIHPPFEEGDCSACHTGTDAQDPGPLKGDMKELCFECHEGHKEFLEKPSQHVPFNEGCTYCHNPHNSVAPALLRDTMDTLCLSCHDTVKNALATAVKHGPAVEGKKCLNCHAPHGGDFKPLLDKEQFDLCLGCHDKDDVKDRRGMVLTNIKQRLDANAEWHAPVGAKECVTCHSPHGSPSFRMLANTFPARFHEGYAKEKYGLCFDCHNDQLAANPTTDSDTEFRDGTRNLHYVHVNKKELGRTCRACHDFHAVKGPSMITDGVKFGRKGWVLKVQFEKNDDGGSCAKSCHSAKSYRRGK
ncbi:MAG: cytochrome C [Deltaproteobacteria bacterium]|nr:cytochrome C [Deltaproteobacteria bacterium]